MMMLTDVMQKLDEMGNEQTRNTMIRHGVNQPSYGVKVGDLKKLVKYVKKDQFLAHELYETGNYDAMYLAGLTVDPKRIAKETLQNWVQKATSYTLAEYTIAGLAAESDYALELSREWMQSENELIATAGWSTYANYVSITPDEHLDLEEIKMLLKQIETTIHTEKNRVRYSMNCFVMCAGIYVEPLQREAVRVAQTIGKVHVNVGQTACKVPLAESYINKTMGMGKCFVKRKTCIC